MSPETPPAIHSTSVVSLRFLEYFRPFLRGEPP